MTLRDSRMHSAADVNSLTLSPRVLWHNYFYVLFCLLITTAPLPSNAHLDATLVILRDSASLKLVQAMCSKSRMEFQSSGLPKKCWIPGKCDHIYKKILKGFSGSLSTKTLRTLEDECLPPGAIVYKEIDKFVVKAEHVNSNGEGPIENERDGGRIPFQEELAYSLGDFFSNGKLWNLDRIDQRQLPLDNSFRYDESAGQNTTVYVVDTGIKAGHQEFTGRVSYGWDFVDDDSEAEDCDGHGTHIAATACGSMVGVAKKAKIVAVRTLDCKGEGTVSGTVSGLDWVSQYAAKPAVILLSLGVQKGFWSQALDDAVKTLISEGLTVVVAAGNQEGDACNYSPGANVDVITVGATDLASKHLNEQSYGPETLYSLSNTGKCVDIFAGGVDILSACGAAHRCAELTDDSYTYASGTSMAAPAVAGIAAVYLGLHPEADAYQVANFIRDTSTLNMIQDSRMIPETVNRMVYNGFENTVLASDGP